MNMIQSYSNIEIWTAPAMILAQSRQSTIIYQSLKGFKLTINILSSVFLETAIGASAGPPVATVDGLVEELLVGATRAHCRVGPQTRRRGLCLAGVVRTERLGAEPLGQVIVAGVNGAAGGRCGRRHGLRLVAHLMEEAVI